MSDFFIKLARELYGEPLTASAPYLARSAFYRRLAEIERQA